MVTEVAVQLGGVWALGATSQSFTVVASRMAPVAAESLASTSICCGAL